MAQHMVFIKTEHADVAQWCHVVTLSVGQGVTLTVEQILCSCGVNLHIVIQSPNMACDISIVIKSIL